MPWPVNGEPPRGSQRTVRPACSAAPPLHRELTSTSARGPAHGSRSVSIIGLQSVSGVPSLRDHSAPGSRRLDAQPAAGPSAPRASPPAHAAGEGPHPRPPRRPRRPIEMVCGAPPRHAIHGRANGRALRRAPLPPRLRSQPMRVAGVALEGAERAAGARSPGTLCGRGPSSHVDCTGERALGTYPA